MVVANPRHASFRPGRVVPLLSDRRAPLKNAFAAVAARAKPVTAGFSSGSFKLFRANLLRSNIQSALAPSALIALPVASLSVITGFLTTLCCAFLAPNNTSSALAPTNDTCTDLRCASSSSFAVPRHATSFALRAPRWPRYRGDNLCSSV